MVTLELKKGQNQLLMKVVNFFGGFGFYFAIKSELTTATPENVLAIVKQPREQRTPQQSAELQKYYRHNVSQDPKWKEMVDTLAALRKQRADFEQTIPTAMVMQEMGQPRDTFVLTRGQYDKQADKVTASVPASLPPLPKDSAADRLALARWLVSSEHPLTSRVIVNRYWQMLFGTGLVETSEDLGSRGELPSHSELLDWLAVEFQESTQSDLAEAGPSRWNVKALLKRIVMSAAYRQDSRVTPEHFDRDPANRLLARGPRVRLQAEFIRDQALAISGLLKHRIGGPSVSPYQPAGLWEELSSRGDSSKWTAQVFSQSTGDDLYRRSMYTFWKRTSPPPQMLALDAPGTDEHAVTGIDSHERSNLRRSISPARRACARRRRDVGRAAADICFPAGNSEGAERIGIERVAVDLARTGRTLLGQVGAGQAASVQRRSGLEQRTRRL
jgi:hypothetical protein